jgi:hypothetical protein
MALRQQSGFTERQDFGNSLRALGTNRTGGVLPFSTKSIEYALS